MLGQLEDGHPTGLVDDNGRMICVGDRLRKPVECNQEFHGEWAIYCVKLQGIVPVIAYVESEKGKLLPAGYLAAPLSDEYDRKMFVFATDPAVSTDIECAIIRGMRAVPVSGRDTVTTSRWGRLHNG